MLAPIQFKHKFYNQRTIYRNRRLYHGQDVKAITSIYDKDEDRVDEKQINNLGDIIMLNVIYGNSSVLFEGLFKEVRYHYFGLLTV